MILNIIKLSLLFLLFCNELNAQKNILVAAQNPEIKEINDIIEIPGSVLANESVNITTVVSEKIKRITF